MTNTIYDVVSPMELKARAYLDHIKDLVIGNASDNTKACELLKEIVTFKKSLKEQKDELLKPLKSQVKEINDKFSTPEDFIGESEVIIRNKINSYLDYVRKEEEKRLAEQKRIAEEKALKEMEELEKQKQNAEGFDPVTKQALQNALEEKQNAIVNATAKEEKINLSNDNAIVRQIWTFEVEDISKVPVEFLSINSVAVNSAIKSGVREIPGIKIFQKSSVSIK